MGTKRPVLKWNDYLRIIFRTFFLQSAFNYGDYQGVGYAYVILPALQKIYKNNKKMLKESALANLEFFNTNPQLSPFVTSLHLAMLDGGQTPEAARSVKMALMGPLAGIGSSLFPYGLAPLFSSIGAGLAADGLIAGPIIFFIGINLCIICTKLFTGYQGYKIGTKALDTLKEKMSNVAKSALIVGITVVSGLAITFVKINVPLKYVAKMPGGEVNEIAVQAILDKIAPEILPVLFILIIYRLIRKYEWSIYKLILLTIFIGVLGSVIGVFA